MPDRNSRRAAPRAVSLAALLATASATLAPGAAQARVARLEVLRTEPAFGGAAFGDAGAYEHVTLRAHGEVDPAIPGNAVIQDLYLAPRNARGMVEYTTDVEILKPAEMARGNRVLFFEVPNRGNKLAIGAFDANVPLPGPERNALASAGDGWLLRQGMTLIWTAWQADVRAIENRMTFQPPVAREPDGSPILGVVRTEMTTLRPTTTLPLGAGWLTGLAHDGYRTARMDNAAPFPDGFVPTLTVRAREADPRVPVPNGQWHFGACPEGAPQAGAQPGGVQAAGGAAAASGALASGAPAGQGTGLGQGTGPEAQADERSLCYPAGFQPGRLYELIYRAKDPTVNGLGFAALRDVAAFLRGAQRDDAGTANPVFRPDQVAIVMGSSQSGRMIRSFIQLGFNRGEDGRQVFDGAYPHIGGGLMPLNIRFSQPGRAWGEQVDHLYPAYDFPFTYAQQADPLTGRQQGLLDRCAATGTCPRIFHVATSLEMWEGRQSLGLTDPLGRQDVGDPPNVRTYIMTSTQHSPAPLPLVAQSPVCQQQPNPNPQIWTMRALMTAFVAWVRDGAAPPPSVVPRIADGSMVAPDQVRFPTIPAEAYGGVERPAVFRTRVYDPLHVLDFGPLYRAGDSSGVITQEPPRVGTAAYGVLVPQVDPDGNDVGGLRSLFVQVPIGTYTGWNLGRRPFFENGMCNLTGSFIPFAATRAEREAVGDPRPSLEERYPTREAYAEAMRAAANRMVAARLLLPDDAAALVAQAERDGVRPAP